MMPRFFALNRLARHSVFALVVLVAREGSAGSDKDYGTPIDPRPPGGGDFGGGGGYLDDGAIDHAAIIGQCGWTGRLPRGNPYDNSGSLSLAWQDGYLDVSVFQWRRSFASSSFNNSMCEMFLLEQLRKDNNGLAKFRDRCESIRADLLTEMNGDESGSSNVGNFSASQAFFGSSRSSSGGGFDPSSSCADADVMSGNERFACRVLALRDIESSPNTLKDYSKKIMADCKKAGADMRRRMSRAEYNSYANSGVSYMGGYCGGGGGGGVVVVQQQNKWYDTLANTALGLTKVIAPLWVMNDANKRANQTAQMALTYNKELGFPSGSYSGTGVGGMGGYGGGGYGYTGHGGACPYGQCGGNGGIIVGGGMGGVVGGIGGGIGGPIGGTCGVPPYAPWAQNYGGCGAMGGGIGGIGGGIGGGVGAPGFGGNPWLNGGAAGRYPGSVYTGGTPGFYGPGGMGGGFGGTGAAGGMPGAFGTLNGGNGWGGAGANMGQWGPGGLYGQTPFYGGAAGGYDAQQATLMAQQMQAYAQSIQRQADLAAKAQSRYKEDLDALYKTYGKSYQSYMAAQTASSGLTGLGGMTGMGMTGMGMGAYGTSAYGAGGGGVYYPPYSSGGSNFSLGLQYNKR